MASGFRLDEKVSMVCDSLLPMLRNDLRKVVDCTCAQHGRPDSAPNFTAAMLCLVACEVVGRLSSDANLDDDAATIAFLKCVAHEANDDRYRQAASALIAYFRNGIVHSFMPKQPSSVKACVKWAQVSGGSAGVCVDQLCGPGGAAMLAELRARHLEVAEVKNEKLFVLVPQVIYVDIVRAIDAFEPDSFPQMCGSRSE